MKAAPEQPPRGPAAFESEEPEALQAQAAILLSVAAQLRGDRAAVQARSAAAAAPVDMLQAEILDEFPIPRLGPPGQRMSRGQAMAAAGARGRKAGAAEAKAAKPADLAALAEHLYERPSTSSAAALSHASLRHPHALVRVAAANAALAVTTEPKEPYRVLVEGTRYKDELVRDVAATSLARYRPDDPALTALVVEPRAPRKGTAETSTLVHGTFAANGTWWRPNGDFWRYVDAKVWDDLYDRNDFYKWSGGYSDGARDQGADLLAAWMNRHSADGLSLMAHSHGTSVTMLASWRGVHFGRVVFLSSPVHPAKYRMNFAAVQKVVSIRVKLDLVLLADGSGARFNDARYNEHVLPIWFNHSATHDPDVWRKHNIPALL